MEIDGASLLKMHHGSFSLKWLLPEDESFGIVARILEYLWTSVLVGMGANMLGLLLVTSLVIPCFTKFRYNIP